MLSTRLPLILLFARGALSGLVSDPELMPDYFQGDIRTPRVLARNGVADEILHWPNGMVPYVIDSYYFDNNQVTQILVGMAVIEEKSCVRFRQTTLEYNPRALIITGRKPGCFTEALGFRDVNRINLQPYPIGEGCFRIGTVIHELLHTLGFEHQHVARNRDEYVRIEWENISKQFYVNFVNDDNSTQWHSYGERYDYDSVMHYIPSAFSNNGKDTIVALREGSEGMGQRVGISISDVKKLNRMYRCPGYE